MVDLTDVAEGTRAPAGGVAAVAPSQGLDSVRPGSGRWATWAPIAAGAWSLAYGGLGLYWALGGAGFPFGGNDSGAAFSILAGARAEVAAPVIAVLGLLGAVVAAMMTRVRGRGLLRVVTLAFAWPAAVSLLVVLPDARALVAVAYAPIVLLGAPFGWPPGDYRNAIPWPVVNQFLCIAGGLAWTAAALAVQRRTGDAGGPGVRWTAPAAAARWGRWATAVAAGVPLVYATTRWAWALGIPLGVTEEFVSLGQADRGTWAGASLGTVAIGGAVLTLGLVQRWGEVFPRWLPGLGGRSVPPALAIVPATLIAVLVTNAGLTFWRRAVLGTTAFPLSGGNWAALGPELLWPVWGAALGTATLAYYLRRRRPPAASPTGRPWATASASERRW